MLSEILTIMVLVGGAYFSYKYIPYQWKRIELERIVKEHAFEIGRASPEQIRESIIDEFESIYDIRLNREDVIIDNGRKNAVITVYWVPYIEFIFGFVYEPTFKVSYSRRKLS
ncbi:MAG: hypothetical protein R3A11_06510 [Bdellovibrionota bacterium]